MYHKRMIESVCVYVTLQAAVKNDENGKVRGLFCALPKQSVFSMCVYGLHPRETFAASISTGPTVAHSIPPPQDPSPLHQYHQLHLPPPRQAVSPKKARPVRDRSVTWDSKGHLGRNMFEWSWFCYPPLDTRQRQTQTTEQPVPSVKGMGHAMRLSTQSSPSLATMSSSFLRFTRSSTPSDILSTRVSLPTGPTLEGDNSASEEGCHVALCRVLMSKVLTVSEGVVDNSHFIEATRQNCDAIYIAARYGHVLHPPFPTVTRFTDKLSMLTAPFWLFVLVVRTTFFCSHVTYCQNSSCIFS